MAPTQPTSWLAVIVPTRDTKDLTLRCLASIPPSDQIEVIVVDDGSADATAQAIADRGYAAQVVRHEHSRGFSAAINSGLLACPGAENVLLLNSDARLRSGALEALRQTLSEHPTIHIMGARLLEADGSSQWSGGRFPTPLWLFVLASGVAEHGRPRLSRRGQAPFEIAARTTCAPVDWVTGAAMVVRRPVIDAVGHLSEQYAFYAQDLDYCARAQKAGFKVAIASAFQVEHDRGATIAATEPTLGDRQAPSLLWSDLLLWVAIHRKGTLGLARFALAAGARLQLATLALGAPFTGSKTETKRVAIRRALRCLRSPRQTTQHRG